MYILHFINEIHRYNKNAMNYKRFFIILTAVMLILGGCASFHPKAGSLKHLQNDIGFEINEKDIIERTEVYNFYGGLQNDGELYQIIKIVLDLSDKAWNEQPLSEEAASFLELSDSEINISNIPHYCWKFINRTPANSSMISDGSLLIYDMEEGILHWICSDI